ncbi:MAG: serpin family protein [Bacillota bacterium]
MARPSLYALILVTFLATTTLWPLGCARRPGDLEAAPARPEPASEVDTLVVAAYTGFALELFAQLRSDRPGENIFLSPASVAVALAMTYNGAEGLTREAMAQVLGIQDLDAARFNEGNRNLLSVLENPDPKVEVTLANSLWARLGFSFHRAFLETNRSYYAAEIREVDFDQPGSPATINAWVSEKTRGKIPSIVQRIDPDHILFLVNAIYFKGSWTTQFEKKATKDGTFTLPDGWQVTHPMMSRSGTFEYYHGDGFQAVRLPYGEGRTSMYVFLPDAESDLAAFLEALNPQAWEYWLGQFGKQEGYLVLPRFKVEAEFDLSDSLKALGMEVAFDPDRADFSGMCPVPPSVFIGSVKHKAFVEVNEEGTEAAAVTSVEMRVTAMPKTFQMLVDRPFVFAIRDDVTGVILFMGAVLDPR